MGKILFFRRGKMIKDKKSTLDLLNEPRKNKEGKQYNLFDCLENREQNLKIVAETLDGLRKQIQSLCLKSNADLVDRHFETTIQRMSAIRIDQKDENPMKLIFDEFTKNGTIPYESKLRDGVTRSIYDDGIMMLMPELKEECKNPTSITARHTLVHEMLHAMSNYTREENGKISYISGMQIHGSNNIFDDLNEGLNEYFTRKILQKMYPNSEIEERYKARTSVIDAFMQQMDEKTQTELFEAYVSGNFDKVLDGQFEEIKTENGESLKQRLNALYQKGFRIGAVLDEQNIKNAKSLIDGFKEFNFQIAQTRQSGD